MTRYTLTLAFDSDHPDAAQLVAATVYNAAAELPEADNVWLLDRPAPLVIVDGEVRGVSGVLRPDAVAFLDSHRPPAGSSAGSATVPTLPAVPDAGDPAPELVGPFHFQYRVTPPSGYSWSARRPDSGYDAAEIAVGTARFVARQRSTTTRVLDSRGTVVAEFLPSGERVVEAVR